MQLFLKKIFKYRNYKNRRFLESAKNQLFVKTIGEGWGNNKGLGIFERNRSDRHAGGSRTLQRFLLFLIGFLYFCSRRYLALLPRFTFLFAAFFSWNAPVRTGWAGR